MLIISNSYWCMTMEISSELLKILVCPVTKGPLIYDKESQELISESAGLAYPIIDAIPILLVDQARKINKNSFKSTSSKLDYINSEESEGNQVA